MRILLDTCTFLWLSGGGRGLPGRAAAAFESPDSDVYLSAVSAWEIAVKHAAGGLPLPDAPERLVPEERERLGILPLPFDEESAIHVTKLPLLHRDPFDRMLVSQAIVHGLTILTPDAWIARYPARTLW
jgi:PIN domain nuclease of toxin-antitoxin system